MTAIHRPGKLSSVRYNLLSDNSLSNAANAKKCVCMCVCVYVCVFEVCVGGEGERERNRYMYITVVMWSVVSCV